VTSSQQHNELLDELQQSYWKEQIEQMTSQKFESGSKQRKLFYEKNNLGSDAENLDSNSDEGAQLTMRNHEATGEIRISNSAECKNQDLQNENSVVEAGVEQRQTDEAAHAVDLEEISEELRTTQQVNSERDLLTQEESTLPEEPRNEIEELLETSGPRF
jgi:hypothetical protein